MNISLTAQNIPLENYTDDDLDKIIDLNMASYITGAVIPVDGDAIL